MKSVFIGFIAFSVAVMMFAQIPAINQPKRNLQALAPMIQANVQAQANIAITQSVLTTVASANNALIGAYSVANATLVATSEGLSAAALNATNALQLVVAANTSAAYNAQINLITAQAALSSLMALEQAFDSFYAQLAPAIATVNTFTVSTVAGTVTTSVNIFTGVANYWTFLGSYLTQLQTNITTIAASAQTSANLVIYVGNSSFVIQNNIAIAQAAQIAAIQKLYTAGSGALATLLTNVGSALAAEVLAPTVAGSITASTTAVNAALTAFATFAQAQDNLQLAANTAVTNAQLVLNVAYYWYTIAQSTILGQEVNSVAAAALATTQTAVLVSSVGYAAGNSTLANNAAIALNNQVMGAQFQATQVSLQNSYRIVMSNLQIATITANQVKICAALGAKATKAAKALRVVRCAAVGNNLKIAQAQNAFLIAN